MATESFIGRTAAVLTLLMAAPVQFTRAEDIPAQESPAGKSENSITVYGGEHFGGSLTDSATNSAIDLQSGSSVAVAVDIGLDRATQLELFFSRQNTALSSSAFSSQNTGLALDSYHIGGTAFIEEMGRGVYVMGGLAPRLPNPTRAGEIPRLSSPAISVSAGWCPWVGMWGFGSKHAAMPFYSTTPARRSAAAAPAAVSRSRAAVCSRARFSRVSPPASDSTAPLQRLQIRRFAP